MKRNLFETIMFASKHAFYLFILQLLGMQLLYANPSNSQTLEQTRLTLNMHEASLEELFTTIEANTTFIFAYNQKIIHSNKRLTLQYHNEPLKDILKDVGKLAKLQFKLINQTISVKPVRVKQAVEGDGVITGSIEDSKGNRLPYAVVKFADREAGTVADAEGLFRLDKVETGTVTLEISYVGYETLTLEATVISGQTTRLDVVLSESSTKLDQVVVYGNLSRGQAKALQEQRSSGNIKNVVDREKFGQFPDQTAAETLQRLPGVSITRDQGEGEMVQVRGVSEEFNMLTLNGERLPSVEDDVEGRSVGLDAIQSFLIDKITLTKAQTADYDGDAIGATVNFQLRKAGIQPEFNAFVAGGLNAQESEFEDLGTGIINFSTMGSRRFFNDRLGVLLAGSYYETNRGSLFNSWRYSDIENNVLSRRRTTDYDVSRERIGLIGNIDFKPDDKTQYTFTYNFNQYNDNEIRRQARYEFSNNREQRYTRNREEQQTFNFFQLRGDHQLGRVKLNYVGSYITGKDESPDRTEFRFRRDTLPALTRQEQEDLSANSAFDLGPFSLQQVRVTPYDNTEDHLVGQVNIELPVIDNNTIKFGGKVRNLEREVRQVTTNRPTPTASTPEIVVPDGGFALSGVTFQDAAFDALNLDTEPVEFDNDDSYNATENVYAGYFMNTTELSGRFSSTIGVRVEYTDQEYTILGDDSFTSSGGYLNVLPSWHLKFETAKNLLFRGSYSSGLTRPNYRVQVPVVTETGVGEVAIGNPDIEATTANNIDLMVEYYTPNLGFYSVGLFAKFIANPVVTRATDELDEDGNITTVTRFENAGDATVLGVEISASQKLSILKVPALKYFGVDFNYTYAYSQVETGSQTEDGTSLDNFPLRRSPRHTGNLSLSYDNPKGFFAVVAGAYRDYVFEKIEGDVPIWLGSTFHLDATIGYNITGFLRAKAQINNITNQPNEEIALEPTETFSRIHEREAYNVWGTVGIELTLR